VFNRGGKGSQSLGGGERAVGDRVTTKSFLKGKGGGEKIVFGGKESLNAKYGGHAWERQRFRAFLAKRPADGRGGVERGERFGSKVNRDVDWKKITNELP